MSSGVQDCSSTAVINHPSPCFKGVAVDPNLEFVDVSLCQFKGKWLVLFSYPLDFTFVCPTEVIAFSEHAKRFNDINCEVVGMSTDSVYCHLEWIGRPRNTGGLGKMNIKLIGDLGGKISKKFGFYSEEAGHDIRGTVIIDPNGIIRHLSMDNPEVGRNVEEVLRLVKAYQFAAEHGEVCPAQWEEGKDTIKPNPKDSKEFFSKVH
ncbi:thioredoxin peroxidase [Histomonas meleagridis]|uniref:thioredoxin peroxidase n=1 Tax=Histomonas meleagridis TaxID=135588 RepID=UPI00355A5A56|nr:thioredoxin peroxidase [Histomonas meleagridis]KAH0785154.1 thioredoxin peroxidase [Histomonas meleagridis]KAH0798831.1 thioredoxin peroxidase [Histomonas meleagridis]KAH0798832.1 thioredoxin peroxidase [Histomonas meleagridis]